MGKKTTKSWDKKQERRLRSYLKANGYLYICSKGSHDKFRVFFLKGVLDTSLLTKGIEYVIADDGICYCDFYKRTKMEDCRYEIGKIYDLVMT